MSPAYLASGLRLSERLAALASRRAEVRVLLPPRQRRGPAVRNALDRCIPLGVGFGGAPNERTRQMWTAQRHRRLFCGV
ncbi:MAG TPA: hypothetical protein VKQ30_25405 [Ktedonobacterales bacterium]|nr:hypothetical protein [Ktedonobacterales bacterium]